MPFKVKKFIYVDRFATNFCPTSSRLRRRKTTLTPSRCSRRSPWTSFQTSVSASKLAPFKIPTASTEKMLENSRIFYPIHLRFIFQIRFNPCLDVWFLLAVFCMLETCVSGKRSMSIGDPSGQFIKALWSKIMTLELYLTWKYPILRL